MDDENDGVPVAESDTDPSLDNKWRKRREDEDDEPSIGSIIEPDDPPSVVEINHLAYIGQQLNDINGNITNFRLIHNDLKTMNEHLDWLAFSVKLGLALGLFSVIALLFLLRTLF